MVNLLLFITYSLYNNYTNALIKTDQVGPFSYVELIFKEDNVYKIVPSAGE